MKLLYKSIQQTKFIFFQATEEILQQVAKNKEHITQFIEKLPNTSEKDKAWNIADAKNRLENGEQIQELQKKYQFYDQLAIIINQIRQNTPPEKQSSILQIIENIIEQRTDGQGRDRKAEEIQNIQKAVEIFFQEQSLLKHKIFQNHMLDQNAGGKVLKALIAEDQKQFEVKYTKVFTPKFWNSIYAIFSSDFPKVVNAFPFPTENDFLASFTHTDQLPDFLQNLKEATIKDAEENIKYFFPEKEAQKHLTSLKAITLDNPNALIQELQKIKNKKEKNRGKAQTKFAKAQRLHRSGKFRAAESEIENLKEQFGENIIRALDASSFMSLLILDLAQEKRLEESLKKSKGKEKERQEEKIKKLKKYDEETEQKLQTTAKRKKATEELLKEIKLKRSQKDLHGAKAAAERLKEHDKPQAEKTIQEITKEMAKSTDDKKDSTAINKENLSSEKQTKIEFLEKCIEHLKKVNEECDRMGIPKDAPEFWGINGVKNRVTWLRKNNLYETYKKFNASDPHIPNTEQAGGFRFRWLDLKTGSNLTARSAESGMGFLQRFKESGYALAALAGAFSLNWTGSSDPLHSPTAFSSLIQSELARVKGE